MPAAMVFALIVVTLAIAGLLVWRPAITAGRGGKIVAFLGLFILPAFAGLLGLDEHVEHSKQTQFCFLVTSWSRTGKA